jgi:hypothetical protein
VSATGNITGGNIISGNAVIGNVTVSGNVVVNSLTSNTYISATSNVIGGNITTTGVITASGNIVGGNLITVGNVVGGNITTNGQVNATGNVSGGNLTANALISSPGLTVTTANLGNLQISNTTITTDGTIGNIVLTPTGSQSIVLIPTTAGLAVPVGNTTQRPAPPTIGTVRFNTSLNRLEVYNGSVWLNQITSGITNETFNGDGSTTTFTLSDITTSAAVLIMLNGITQVPGIAYNMSPNPSTTLVFNEAPATGDVIDIRIL